MTLQRSMVRPAALAAALLLVGAAGAVAQERPLFEWRGRVDKEIRLEMRGRSLDTHFAGWKDLGRDRTRVFSVLPREDGWVYARVVDGRGDVDVTEQPSARNNYTAVIRVRDRRGGADNYVVQAFWRPRNDDRGGYDRGGWDRRDPGDRDRDDRGRNNGGWNNGGWNNGNGGAWNGRGDLRWSGSIDDELEIRIRGRDVSYRNVRGDGTRNVRANLQGELPQRDVSVRVDQHSGRGQVEVVQQPSAWNGYTAVLRVRDRNAGAGYYDFDVTW